MEASENKTDRKLDILSRTIPTPGAMRRREESPDGDTSMEQSFESAEQSLSVSEDTSSDHGSYPFLVPSKPRQHAIEQDEDAEDGSDTASEDEDENEDEDDEEAVNATLSPRHRRDTVRPTPALADVSMESEDPLAAMDHLNVSAHGAGSSDLTDEEGVSDEDEDEEEDDDEEEEDEEMEDDEEVADDEDEGEAGESSFAASTATSDTASNSDTDSDVYSERGRGGRNSDESAVGRGATQRRKSGSPVKKSTPSIPSAFKSKPKTAPTRVSAKKVVSPLQEKMVQDVIEVSDDEIVAVKTPQKKRYVPSFCVGTLLKIRVLGKKVMTEDEMIAADSKVGTGVAEVRRMMRGSGQFTPSRFVT